jgi:hypothetical protein
MLAFAHDARRWERGASLLAALLLQGCFILILIASLPVLRPPAQLARELTLFLPRPTPARTREGPATLQAAPVIITPALPQTLEQAAPGAVPTAPALIPGLQNFGQALNSCAPEQYGQLTAEQQAHCPRPGAGVAIQEFPDPLNVPRHAKDEALWQEQWSEKHWMPGLCGPGDETVALCMMNQSIAEAERRADVDWHLNRDKARALQH